MFIKYTKSWKRYSKVIDYTPIAAPIKNDILGTLKVFYKDELINEYQVLAFEDVKKVNIFPINKIGKLFNLCDIKNHL